MHITPPHVFHSLSNAAWDSLTCSVLSGLVKLSAAQFASEHTQRSSMVKSFFTCGQKSFVIRSWVCVFRERPFLKASCIGLLSTSTTAGAPLEVAWVGRCRQFEYLVYSANVSLTLICVLCHDTGENEKSAERSPNQAAPCMGRGVCGVSILTAVSL